MVTFARKFQFCKSIFSEFRIILKLKTIENFATPKNPKKKTFLTDPGTLKNHGFLSLILQYATFLRNQGVQNVYLDVYARRDRFF